MDKNATITIDSDDDAADCSVELIEEVPAKQNGYSPVTIIGHEDEHKSEYKSDRKPEYETLEESDYESTEGPLDEPKSQPRQEPGYEPIDDSEYETLDGPDNESVEGYQHESQHESQQESQQSNRTVVDLAVNHKPDKKQQREEAKRQKELEKAKKKIERQAEVANAACKSLLNCTAHIEYSAVEIIDSERHTFETLFDEAGAQFKVSYTAEIPKSITWQWRRTEVKNGQLVENIDDVRLLMIVMSGSDYLKRLLMCRDEPKNSESLKNYVCDIMRASDANINLLVFNLSKVLKEAKRNDDNAFRKKFRRTYESDEPSNSADRSAALLGIGVTDLQDIRLDMQLEIHRDHPGRKFQIEFEEKREEAVNLIIRYTKSAAKLQIESRKVEDIDVSFPLSAEKEKAFDPTKNLAGLWESQLMQFGQLTRAHAKAIVAQYESPASLIEGYEGLSAEDGEMLLGDINIGRTQKKVPPTLSRRIYRAMTSRNPNLFLGVD